MSTYDNGAIETPEWSPEPHKWDETAYLMASPANAERLRASVARLHACPFDPCFVCQPHEGGGTYPPPNAVLGEN